MPCRKGVWKVATLWEHPLGKGEATCHSSPLVHGFMHRRCVEGYFKSSLFTHDADGREHSTCCRRNLYHNILLVFGLIILWHPEMSLSSVDLTVVYGSVLHLILDSVWVWYSLLLELKIPTWLDIEVLYCVFDIKKSILSKWWERSYKLLEKSLKVAGNIWWRERTILWVLDFEVHWHCEDNGHIWASYLSEDLCDEMFRCCEDNTYIIVIVLFG